MLTWPCTGRQLEADAVHAYAQSWHMHARLKAMGFLTQGVYVVQLLQAITANKATTYFNGHDHTLTLGNPAQPLAGTP